MNQNAESVRLSKAQSESLAAWYDISRTSTEGYYAGEFSDRKPTMDVLHRKGIIGKPHRGAISVEWSATITDLGLTVAKRCSEQQAQNDSSEARP